MAQNMTNKTEHEIYLDEVCGYMATFMNELDDGNRHVVERTVEQMKKRFALDDAQEAALTIALFHLETLHSEADENFNIHGLVGLECHVIADILTKDYRSICDRRLADADTNDEADDVPEEVQEAMRAFGTMLIDWYGGQVGAANVIPIKTETVLRRFRIGKDNKQQATDILDYFRSQMERYRHSAASDNKVARLIDNTIERLLAVSDGE